MLYSHTVIPSSSVESHRSSPIPVFLHGFLGSSQDWSATLEYLNCSAAICLDLPCHGVSKYCEVDDFAQACQQVQTTVLEALQKSGLPTSTPLVLVGYSLGARIAMYGLAQAGFTELNVQGAILEGGNVGLATEEEKVLRWENDKHWSKRFATEAMDEVLFDWYQQGVFASLTPTQREHLIELRSDNLGAQLACVLRATSLAKQPHLLASLTSLTLPLLYVCGDKDTKFVALAEQSGLQYRKVNHAGHNAHHEQPNEFATIVTEFIQQLSSTITK
ncbi:2-succinyl-6-hydroxy-2,4-cyclohexadiene-1-carboxylate synthase [Vibrio aphrogenes]|uniref:2-succinyl-6-hydroxy-2, 4-cyclohexadiene-1-carboxylate synthase n=1 Tax=Vibrio aphrogenes TaxID=1891186 RepID=UPI000B3549B3|nr:2-succinyl-6-hydroxy-2,4-cyclohexadiene-1-carboxylate synthase [Vibrio aphrogenes]